MSSERAQQNAELFDRVAGTYDQLGFLAMAARFLTEKLMIRPGERVLDVATGTGEVALGLARSGAVVTGVDLAPEMIAVAQAKAQTAEQVDFLVADAMNLPFEDAQFDWVVCAAGLFFMPDMTAALMEWRRVLKPGGRVVFSSFGRGLLGDLPGRWREELLAYGLKPGSPPLGRIPTVEAARDLLLASSLTDIRVELHDLVYVLPGPEARWQDILLGLEGVPLQNWTPELRLQIEQQHLAQLRKLPWPQRVPVPLVLAQGHRPLLDDATTEAVVA